MKVLIDADACPVTAIAARMAAARGIPVVLVCDTNHAQHVAGAQCVTVDPGADSADLALVNRCAPGDLVVTQDYGVAALALGRGAYALHPGGRRYTDGNIDGLLADRCAAKRQRRACGKHHLKGPPKRTAADDRAFESAMRALLDEILPKNEER